MRRQMQRHFPAVRIARAGLRDACSRRRIGCRAARSPMSASRSSSGIRSLSWSGSTAPSSSGFRTCTAPDRGLPGFGPRLQQVQPYLLEGERRSSPRTLAAIRHRSRLPSARSRALRRVIEVIPPPRHELRKGKRSRILSRAAPAPERSRRHELDDRTGGVGGPEGTGPPGVRLRGGYWGTRSGFWRGEFGG
jgi:hypothetical protein